MDAKVKDSICRRAVVQQPHFSIATGAGPLRDTAAGALFQEGQAIFFWGAQAVGQNGLWCGGGLQSSGCDRCGTHSHGHD